MNKELINTDTSGKHKAELYSYDLSDLELLKQYLYEELETVLQTIRIKESVNNG